MDGPSDAPPTAGGRRIALIAHDNMKPDMREWAAYNRHRLVEHQLFATATRGRILHDELALDITCFRSGPFGGDQQIGARIAEGQIAWCSSGTRCSRIRTIPT